MIWAAMQPWHLFRATRHFSDFDKCQLRRFFLKCLMDAMSAAYLHRSASCGAWERSA